MPAALDVARASAARLTDDIERLMRQASAEALLPRLGALRADEIEEKAPAELVTVADRHCERLLAAGLSAMLPEAQVVGEEMSDGDRALLAQLGNALCWIIDPLDGTGNFVAGKAPFGVMIALASGGQTIGGWILQPVGGEFASAVHGQGARFNGKLVSGRRPTALRPRLGISALVSRNRNLRQQLETIFGGSFELVDLPRCAAYVYPALVSGELDLALFARTLPWDHAPGVLLMEEMGGRCRRLDGNLYRVDQDRTGLLAAATPELWDHAQRLLEGLSI